MYRSELKYLSFPARGLQMAEFRGAIRSVGGMREVLCRFYCIVCLGCRWRHVSTQSAGSQGSACSSPDCTNPRYCMAGAAARPQQEQPVAQLPGRARLVQAAVLPDRRHVLTRDAEDQVMARQPFVDPGRDRCASASPTCEALAGRAADGCQSGTQSSNKHWLLTFGVLIKLHSPQQRADSRETASAKHRCSLRAGAAMGRDHGECDRQLRRGRLCRQAAGTVPTRQRPILVHLRDQLRHAGRLVVSLAGGQAAALDDFMK